MAAEGFPCAMCREALDEPQHWTSPSPHATGRSGAWAAQLCGTTQLLHRSWKSPRCSLQVVLFEGDELQQHLHTSPNLRAQWCISRPGYPSPLHSLPSTLSSLPTAAAVPPSDFQKAALPQGWTQGLTCPCGQGQNCTRQQKPFMAQNCL